MAENIYIGNRYVPLHMGAWDSSVDYEYLSAVTQGGNAYVSKRNVPAGTPVTDTDYWAFWGSGNAVIDALSVRLASLENRTGNIETRVDKNEADIVELYRRMGLVETNVDSLFAEQGAQSVLIGQLQTAITALQNNISSIQAELLLTEKTANKNTVSGYMGLTNGYADRPTLYASPLIMTANITASQTLTSGTQIVRFNNILHSTQVGLTEMISPVYTGSGAGNFIVTGPSAYYDVWLSASVLCVPQGNTGVKDVYVNFNSESRFATEAYFPTGATRISIQIPEVYVGTVRGGGQDQFGVIVTNWAVGDVIGQGSIPGDNYGSTWVSIKAYRRTLPVG